jgi:DNA-binding NarL/FixJ family response regulator
MLWEKLTPRQAQIAELLCEGKNNVEIAKTLGINVRSVKAHFWSMFITFNIGRHGMPRIRLAVALVYDRYPDLQPDAYIQACSAD